jgi:hypothetical protein
LGEDAGTVRLTVSASGSPRMTSRSPSMSTEGAAAAGAAATSTAERKRPGRRVFGRRRMAPLTDEAEPLVPLVDELVARRRSYGQIRLPRGEL